MTAASASPAPSRINGVEVYPHRGNIDRCTRNRRFGHASGVVWLTGLSGAGKSTLAVLAEQRLFARGCLVCVLDGDTVRAGLNADLDFTARSREENLRRAGELAALFAEAGHIVLATFVSPHAAGRARVRQILGDDFHLVHVTARLEDCIERDPKGLYGKALRGEIENFTGIGQSYETPEDTDLLIDTSAGDVDACAAQLVSFIEQRFALAPDAAVREG